MGEQLIVTIGAKDSASTVIKKVNNELKYLDKEYSLAKKSSKDFEDSQEGLRTKLDYLSNKYDATKTKLQAYKSQLDKSRESVAKKEEELEKLKETEGDNTKAIEKAEKQLETYKNKLDKATKNISLTEAELNNLGTEINNTNGAINDFKVNQFKAQMEEAAQATEKAGNKIKNIGAGISSVGGGLMKLSAPVVAGSVAIAKMSADFDEGIANINTLLDDTTNLDSYRKKIIQLSNDTGQNIEIVTDGMYEAISSLGDLGEETEGIFEVMAKSAKAGKAETADSVSLISSAMKGYGSVSAETAQKVSDLAFVTANLGVTTFPEMAKNMQPLFPLSSALNFSFEELFGSMATLTGVTGNTAEVSTQLKAIFSNLIKPTSDMADLIAKYGYSNAQAMIQTEGMAGVLNILQKETGGSLDKMGLLFSSTEALTAITALCGANYDDFINKSAAMNTALGATDTAMEKVSSTEKDKLTRSINRLKNSFLEGGEKLAPLIDALADGVDKVADALSKMNPETVLAIAKVGLFTMATGGALKAVGGLTSGVGSLVVNSSKAISKFSDFASKTKAVEKVSTFASTGGVGKLGAAFTALGPASLAAGAGIAAVAGGVLVAKTNADLMNKTILYTKDEMNGLEKVLNTFNGTQFKTKQELIDSGLVYKDFSENISKEFKEAVKSNTDDINNFALMLGKITFDNTLTEEEIKAFTDRIDGAVSSAIGVINSRQAESSKALNELFMNDGIINENERLIQEFFTSKAEKSISEVEQLGVEIKELQQQINATNNQQEIAQLEELIKEKYNRIKKIELEYVGSNAEEIIYAKNEFNARTKSIDLKDASSLMQEKAKLRDDEIVKIKASYDTQIELLKSNLVEMDDATRAAAETEIEEYERAKQEKINVQNSLYDEFLKILSQKNPEILAQMNEFNGMVLGENDKRNKQELKNMKDYYAGLEKITESGTYDVWNIQNNAYEKMVIKTDEATGRIIGMAKLQADETGFYCGEVAGYTAEVEKSMQSEAQTAVDSKNKIINSLIDITNYAVDSSGKIVSSNGEVITSLEGFKRETDDVRSGIINLNGTPVQVNVNNKGAITNLQDVINKMARINDKTVTLTVKEQRWASSARPIYDGYASGTDRASQGTKLVAEEGPELIVKGNRSILASGMQLFNFSGGEKVYTADETKQLLTSGSYYNKDSLASRELINATNIYNTSNVQNSKINYEDIMRVAAKAMAEALKDITLKGTVTVEDNNIVKRVSNEFAMAGKRVR